MTAEHEAIARGPTPMPLPSALSPSPTNRTASRLAFRIRSSMMFGSSWRAQSETVTLAAMAQQQASTSK